MNKKKMELANRMAAELYDVIKDSQQACGQQTVMTETQDLLWKWELSKSILLGVLVQMAEKGYSVAIGEPHYCEPEEVFLRSDYETAQGLAQAAHQWHDQMDMVDCYFFQEGESKADGWLVWVPGNCEGEQLCDYVVGGDLEQVIEAVEAAA